MTFFKHLREHLPDISLTNDYFSRLEHAFGLNIKVFLGPNKLWENREKSKYLTPKKSAIFRKSWFRVNISTRNPPRFSGAKVEYAYGHNLTRILNLIFFPDKACKTRFLVHQKSKKF